MHGIICVVLILLGGVGTYRILVGPAIDVVRARSWTPVACQVADADAKTSETVRPAAQDERQRRAVLHGFGLRFTYVVDGRSYESTRYSFQDDVYTSGASRTRRLLSLYPPGTRTTCWVNPEDARDAVLSRHFQSVMLVGLAPFLMFFVGLAGTGLLPERPFVLFAEWWERRERAAKAARLEGRAPPWPPDGLYGLYAALLVVLIAFVDLVVAVADGHEGVWALTLRLGLLGALTEGYRRRVAACGVALVAYPVLMLATSLGSWLAPDWPHTLGNLGLDTLALWVERYAREAASFSLVQGGLAILVFRGTRALLAAAPATRPQALATAAAAGVCLLSLAGAVMVTRGNAGQPVQPAQPPRPTSAQLLATLEGHNRAAWRGACDTLATTDVAPAFLEPLQRIARTADESTRVACLGAIGRSLRLGGPALPLLRESTRDSSAPVRAAAVTALAQVAAPTGADVLGDLVPLTRDADVAVRRAAVGALTGRVEDAPVVVPVARAALRDGDAGVRRLAASVLWLLGPAAVDAAPDLAELVGREPAPEVRQAVVEALEHMDSPAAVPGLALAVEDADPALRYRAAVALGRLGPAAAAAAPALRARLGKETDERIRERIASALERIDDN